jgi:hypothetical protein
MLIAIGTVLIPEAYNAASGELWASSHVIHTELREPPMVFLWRGQVLQGNVTANASLNLYIMDEPNYIALVEGHQWQPLISLLDFSNQSFNFIASNSGYYRIIIDVKPPQETANLTYSAAYYGIDRDHYDSGIAFTTVGAILGIIALIGFLRSKLKVRWRRGRDLTEIARESTH